MFPCPDFVRQLIEYFRRFFATIDHNHDADYSTTDHDHDDAYYTESEVDTLLSDKADDPPVNDDRYYTESEVDTLLAGKADLNHSHPNYAAPQWAHATMGGGNWTTSGTDIQTLPNLQTAISPTKQGLLIQFCIPLYVVSGTNPNITFHITVDTVTYDVGQWRSVGSTAGNVDVVSGFIVAWVSTGGNKLISVQVKPYTGVFRFNDTYRVPRLYVSDFGPDI